MGWNQFWRTFLISMQQAQDIHDIFFHWFYLKREPERCQAPRDVKLRQEVVNIWIFVFLAKQNISTDWEPKNSAEKPVLLASTFSWLFSAALKLCLDLLSSSQNAQKFKCSRHLAGAWHLSGYRFLNAYDFNKESSGSRVSNEGLGSTTDPKFTLAISLFLAGNWCGWNIEENEKGGM